MREKIPGIPLNTVNTSDLGKQERREQSLLRALEAEGRRRVDQKESFHTELEERRALAKTFLLGDSIGVGGRIGRVAEASKADLQKGNVLVQFGKGEAVPYNPKVLRNLSKEKRENR